MTEVKVLNTFSKTLVDWNALRDTFTEVSSSPKDPRLKGGFVDEADVVMAKSHFLVSPPCPKSWLFSKFLGRMENNFTSVSVRT